MKDVEKFEKFEELKKVEIIPKGNHENYQVYVEEFIQLLKVHPCDIDKSLRIPKGN
jgi:hypothetical protein